MNRKNLCDEDCNNCPVIGHNNNRLLTKIFNELLKKFGDGVYTIVQDNCPNMTVCHECRVDDFCHMEGCTIMAEIKEEPTYKDFSEWYKRLSELAQERGCVFLLPPQEHYPEDGYDDGETPEDELEGIIGACD